MTFSREAGDLASGPQHCPLCPASPYPGPGRPRRLCKCERREESPELGSRGHYCGREKAGNETTAASLAVASVSEQVSGRSKGGM